MLPLKSFRRLYSKYSDTQFDLLTIIWQQSTERAKIQNRLQRSIDGVNRKIHGAGTKLSFFKYSRFQIFVFWGVRFFWFLEVF